MSAWKTPFAFRSSAGMGASQVPSLDLEPFVKKAFRQSACWWCFSRLCGGTRVAVGAQLLLDSEAFISICVWNEHMPFWNASKTPFPPSFSFRYCGLSHRRLFAGFWSQLPWASRALSWQWHFGQQFVRITGASRWPQLWQLCCFTRCFLWAAWYGLTPMFFWCALDADAKRPQTGRDSMVVLKLAPWNKCHYK